MKEFFIFSPFLQAAEDQTMSMLMMLGMVAAVILVFYFLIIRPQNKRQKQLQHMIDSLKKGDKVVTIGGIRGSVFSVKEQTVVLKVDDETKIEFNKNAIAQVIERGDEPKEVSAENK